MACQEHRPPASEAQVQAADPRCHASCLLRLAACQPVPRAPWLGGTIVFWSWKPGAWCSTSRSPRPPPTTCPSCCKYAEKRRRTVFDPFTPATEVAQLIVSGAVSSAEVTAAYLDRIERYNPQLNCFVWLDQEATLEEARRADARLAAGEEVGTFHGVPVPIKDLTEAAGQPCTFGSLGISDAPASSSEVVVERLQAAGFILMGRTAAPEAGTMSVTESRRNGICRNPWDLDRSPAGSSGGRPRPSRQGLPPSRMPPMAVGRSACRRRVAVWSD